MTRYLGIDTSNYTTSAALYDAGAKTMLQQKKLLSVQPGEKGLRQSEALFQHVRELPGLLENLLDGGDIDAVGFSSRPRDAEGSYMPCFLAGVGAARSIAAAMGIKSYAFSHQEGHIAAALYSIDRFDLLCGRFIAFHVSGGTTDVILYTPGKKQGLALSPVASSLDLKAGQAIDRVGQLLDLGFPAGPQLEKLAEKSARRFNIRPCLKGLDCCLSGVENICADMVKKREAPCDVARFCLEYVKATLDGMTAAVLDKLGPLPLVFAGGVMSNAGIRDYMTEKYGALFAKPGFSSDNAAGIAALAKLASEGL